MSQLVLDVTCVGPCRLSRTAAARGESGAFSVRGALEVAALLSEAELSVGLASQMDGAVIHGVLARHAASLGILMGPWRGLRPTSQGNDPSARIEREMFSIPERWHSNVLVISGIDASVARAGNLCRLARAFRREGAVVIVDLRSELAWSHERSPLVVRSLLRESDVVRVRREDIDMLQLVLADFFAMVRPDGVVLVSGQSGEKPTLEVHVGETRTIALRDREVHSLAGRDALIAAVAAVCATQGALRPSEDATWDRVIARLELFADR